MRQMSEAARPVTGARTISPSPRSDGREDFVRAVYHHHSAPLLRYATRLLHGDRHRAEDLLQEAAARAWRHFTAVTDPLSIRPWLFTVVRNLAIDHHRARSARPPETHPLDGLVLSVDDTIERVLTTQIVLDALTRLVPAHRDVITLVYYRGYSVTQAARCLGIPNGTVKSRSHHALRALRVTLHANGVTHA